MTFNVKSINEATFYLSQIEASLESTAGQIVLNKINPEIAEKHVLALQTTLQELLSDLMDNNVPYYEDSRFQSKVNKTYNYISKVVNFARSSDKQNGVEKQ